jgi:hypothetical protein
VPSSEGYLDVLANALFINAVPLDKSNLFTASHICLAYVIATVFNVLAAAAAVEVVEALPLHVWHAVLCTFGQVSTSADSFLRQMQNAGLPKAYPVSHMSCLSVTIAFRWLLWVTIGRVVSLPQLSMHILKATTGLWQPYVESRAQVARSHFPGGQAYWLVWVSQRSQLLQSF